MTRSCRDARTQALQELLQRSVRAGEVPPAPPRWPLGRIREMLALDLTAS
eukprot:CAMPEP_0180667252 /NCGR_PEP_ID=MMETSP1037_2-20121125/62280_1 /TAXON_ID=632150 /ORGANISM="Azadinium spinosum, Strain 3D9" /LENGTH=49 /DNA_ID= /DNA_START= /DNA_END= /DNA_ORIENTATION=